MIKLHSGEEIKLIVRKHWFVFVGKAFVAVLLLFMPLIFWGLLSWVGDYATVDGTNVFADIIGGIPILFLIILWTFFIWMWSFILWTDYYLDTWVITNRRIIGIDQKGFFSREVSTFRMERVQDVTIEVSGLIPTFFNFGNITVQTAGDSKSFVMPGAPAPANVKAVISAILESQRNSVDGQNQGL